MGGMSSLTTPAMGLRFRWQVTPLRVAAGLTLLALTLRLIGIGARPLWLDEGYSAWFSVQSWHVLWTAVPTFEPHPPFYYSLLKLWRDLFGGSPDALRAFSVLFGIAAVPIVVAASGELERLRPSSRPELRAAVAAFLIACSPMLVLLDQEARPYPLLIFGYALAILGLLRLMREFSSAGPGHWSSWLMLAIGTAVGLWAHGLGLLYALCLAAALAPGLFERPFGADRIFRGIAAASFVIVLYLPCLLMILNRVGDWGGSGWLIWKPLMALQLLSLYSVPVEVLTIGSAVSALIMILLAKRAIQAGVQAPGWNAERALLLLWWGPPILAIIISKLAIPIFLPRTLAATLIPAYLAIAGAVVRVEDDRERLFLAAAMFITLLPSSIEIALRPPTEQWKEVRSYLEHNTHGGDQVWLYPNDSALPLREAGLRLPARGIPGDYPATAYKGPIRAGSPAVVSLTGAQAMALAANTGKDGTIWLVTRQSALFDPSNDLPSALARVRRPGKMQEWGYINVRPYYRR
jgi:mannosyltransferase